MQTFLRTVARVVGSEVIDDVVAFFRAFEGMEAGFREPRAGRRRLLADPDTAFVLVTSPRRDAMDEATFFAERLADAGQSVARADREPRAPDVRRRSARRAARRGRGARGARAGDATSEAAARLAALYDNLADFREIAALERAHLEDLQARIGARPPSRTCRTSPTTCTTSPRCARSAELLRYSLDPMTQCPAR